MAKASTQHCKAPLCCDHGQPSGFKRHFPYFLANGQITIPFEESGSGQSSSTVSSWISLRVWCLFSLQNKTVIMQPDPAKNFKRWPKVAVLVSNETRLLLIVLYGDVISPSTLRCMSLLGGLISLSISD